MREASLQTQREASRLTSLYCQHIAPKGEVRVESNVTSIG